MMRRWIAALAFALCWTGPRVATAEQAERILVMPFENIKRDGRIFWLGEASSVLIADDLSALGANAIVREERQQAFERLQVPPVAILTDATVIRIGQLLGAGRVIVGSLELENDTLIVRARSIALETGRVQFDVTDRGTLPNLFAIFQRVARRMEPPSARSSADVERQHPPVAAFETYIKGLLAETPETAISYLRGALMVQPNFHRVRLALWDVYADQGDDLRALEAVKPVPAASPWGRRARFLAGLSQLYLKRYEDAFVTFQALASQQVTATVLNNLGVVQMRRGATAPSEQPTSYFKRAAELDPDDPDYLFNLGYASWEARDVQAAIYWLREMVRHNPTDGDAHFVLSAALSATGNAVEAAREKELARRLSSVYEQWEKRPPSDPVPKALERVKNAVELPHAHRIETTLATNEKRSQQELTRFYLDRGQRLFQQESDREAVTELNHALYLSPYLAEAHLLLGRIHLRNGRVRAAIDAFKISLWSADTSEGHAGLGEAYRQAKDVAAARTEAERAVALDPSSTEARHLLDMLKSP